MNLKQFLEAGVPKILHTRYDPNKEELTDPELEAIKKKIAKAKTFDEIKALLASGDKTKQAAS